jgi:hypothetical protein
MQIYEPFLATWKKLKFHGCPSPKSQDYQEFRDIILILHMRMCLVHTLAKGKSFVQNYLSMDQKAAVAFQIGWYFG